MKSFSIAFSGFSVDQHGTAETRQVKNTPTIQFASDLAPNEFLNKLYSETNRQYGEIYETILASGYEGRTTLSIGDIVVVDIIRYIVCEMGFACIDNMLVDYVK